MEEHRQEGTRKALVTRRRTYVTDWLPSSRDRVLFDFFNFITEEQRETCPFKNGVEIPLQRLCSRSWLTVSSVMRI